MSKSYMFATPIERVRHNQELRPWPLHVTLLPWVHIDGNLPAVNESIADIELVPFQYVVGSVAMFGANNDIRVSLVEDSSPMISLHNDLHQAIKKSGGKVEDTKYIGKNFRPHITHKDEAKPIQGDQFIFDELIIVELDTEAETKKVVEKIDV